MTEYEASQVQRGIEREIRKQKRTVKALEAVGQDASAERKKLREAQKAYTDFTEQTGMRKQSARTQIASAKAEREVRAAGAKLSTKKSIEKQRDEMPMPLTNSTKNNKETLGDLSIESVSKSRIIESRNGLTKVNASGKVLNPMSKTQYNTMKKSVEAKGYSVVSATTGDDLRYLRAIGAEAIADEYGILHMGEIPSVSAFFEEIIHLKQIERYGKMKESDFVERAAREISANRKLLKNGKAYGFTDEDFSEIEINLQSWEEDFKKRTGMSFDESGIIR